MNKKLTFIVIIYLLFPATYILAQQNKILAKFPGCLNLNILKCQGFLQQRLYYYIEVAMHFL